MSHPGRQPAARTGSCHFVIISPARGRPSSKVSSVSTWETPSHNPPRNFKYQWSGLGRQNPLLQPLKASDPPRAEGLIFPSSGDQQQQWPQNQVRFPPPPNQDYSFIVTSLHGPHSVTDSHTHGSHTTGPSGTLTPRGSLQAITMNRMEAKFIK